MSDVTETSTIATEFRKMLKYKISQKTVQWEPICPMRTEGETDMTKLVVAFRNSAKAPATVAFIGFDCMVQL